MHTAKKEEKQEIRQKEIRFGLKEIRFGYLNLNDIKKEERWKEIAVKEKKEE